ncbi:MAG: secondary thiamine-phosphate synthase enzyme YjbQ [Dehalococcoidia bacterium]
MTAPRTQGGVVAPPIFRQAPSGQPFTFAQHHLECQTEAAPSFLDITDDVRQVVRECGVRWGQVTVFSHHTTAAIRLQENEPLLIEDLKDMLRELAPRDRYYRHNDFDIRTVNMRPNEPKNGHSHCQHILLSASETIPLVGGDLQLGRFQSVFLVELDRALERRVTVNVLGVPGAE